MSVTINTKVFTSFRTQADSNMLTGALNTPTVKDSLTLRRTFPKPVKDNPGVSRPGFKVVKTLACSDGFKRDMIVDVSGSVPVGAVEADVLAVLADIAAFAGLQDCKDLFTKLDINA